MTQPPSTTPAAPASSHPGLPPRAVIFDWDGVIADSVGLYVDLYTRVCTHFGKGSPPRTVEGFRSWYQPRWEQNYVDMGYSAAELREVLSYAEEQLSYLSTPLYEGAVEAVRALALSVPLGICSTTHARHIHQALEQAGLAGCFAVVVGGEGGGSDKTERFGRTARLLGLGEDAAIAVGDTPHDVECGQHWGMRTVGVTYGWCEAERVRAASPDVVIDSPSALEAGIRSLLAPCP